MIIVVTCYWSSRYRVDEIPISVERDNAARRQTIVLRIKARQAFLAHGSSLARAVLAQFLLCRRKAMGSLIFDSPCCRHPVHDRRLFAAHYAPNYAAKPLLSFTAGRSLSLRTTQKPGSSRHCIVIYQFDSQLAEYIMWAIVPDFYAVPLCRRHPQYFNNLPQAGHR